ncbi:MAG: glycosyltransferase family 4 protein [Candidatus Nanoarchaeia archaeon]|nr:glycosyltransferase family 4 protein [Candidatus Nanoarchaeia archaeon]
MKVLFITHAGTKYENISSIAEIVDEVTVLGYIKHRNEIIRYPPQPSIKENIRIIYAKNLISFLLKPRKIKADLVIAHCPISGLAAYLSGKKFKFLMCQDFYEYHELVRQPKLKKLISLFLIKAMTRISCKNASSVICLSTYIQKKAIGYGAKKTNVIPMWGIDMKHLSPNNKDPDLKKKLGIKNQKVLFTLARLSPEKGLQYLIKSIKILEKENIFLIIAGKGSEEIYLKNLVKQLNLGSKIIFINYIPFEEVPHYHNIADICLLVSLKEGLGIGAIEPLACKKPVIGSNTGGIVDTIIHNKTGLLVEPGNSQQIADSIMLLLKDKKLRYRLVQEGFKHVSKNFEQKKVIKRYQEEILN